MLEKIKSIIIDELQTNDVSLGIIFDRTGNILWHAGRPIQGKTVPEGKGFSKTLLTRVIRENSLVEEQNVSVSCADQLDGSTASTRKLQIQSVLIQPLNGYYFYIDSGIKRRFEKKDIKHLCFIGKLLQEYLDHVKNRTRDTGGISGTSDTINTIRDRVITYSVEDQPILMTGETGVGKNHIARLIHQYSGRKGKFVIVDTPNIQDKLFDTTLFGHRKGAFTDAVSNKRGLVEEAEGGTLFFDEIAEVPMDIQTKLLRFIDTKKYYILGDSREHKADVRIIAASNKDLKESQQNREFRTDLYYRLSILEIEIPPLRNRISDVRELVAENIHLLRGKKIGQGFWKVLEHHTWPGNIRELISVLIRAGICCPDPITASELREVIHRSTDPTLPPQRSLPVDEIYEDMVTGNRNFWDAVKHPFLKRDIDRATVREIVHRGMAEDKVQHKYINLLRHFNLNDNEYQKFMTFLRDYDLK